MQTLEKALLTCCKEWHRKSNENDLELSAVFIFPPDFPGFQGHFPQQSVLPGIVQLAAVRKLAELSLKMSLSPNSYRRCRFKNIVSPGEEISIHLSLSPSDDGWQGKFTIRKRQQEELVADGFCSFLPSVS